MDLAPLSVRLSVFCSFILLSGQHLLYHLTIRNQTLNAGALWYVGKGKVTARVSLVQMTVQSISSERWNYPTNQLNADTNRFGDVIMSNKGAKNNWLRLSTVMQTFGLVSGKRQ